MKARQVRIEEPDYSQTVSAKEWELLAEHTEQDRGTSLSGGGG